MSTRRPPTPVESAGLLLAAAAVIATVGGVLGTPWSYAGAAGAVLLLASVVWTLRRPREQPSPEASTIKVGPGYTRAINLATGEATPWRNVGEVRLDHVLREFPATQREIFRAHYKHGKPIPAIACTARIPTGTIQAILNAMTARVSEELGDTWLRHLR